MADVIELFRKSTSLLRGEDGRLSFSKVVLLILIAGWYSGRELEAGLAGVFLSAAFGYRAFRLHQSGKEGDRA